jgi:hypothetical protein
MFKRPGSAKWQLRKPVPIDVQAAYGRVVFTKSLGTSDDRAATKAAMEILDELDKRWDALRRGEEIGSTRDIGAATSSGEPSQHVKRAIVRAVYEQVLRGTEERDNAAFTADALLTSVI